MIEEVSALDSKISLRLRVDAPQKKAGDAAGLLQYRPVQLSGNHVQNQLLDLSVTQAKASHFQNTHRI